MYHVSHLLISIRGLQVEDLCHLNFRLCKRGASWAVRSFAYIYIYIYAHRANVHRKQEGRSRLIHPSSCKSFVDGDSGMLRLALAEYRLDRPSSGEQTGRVCRKSAAVIASQSCRQREQHGCNRRELVSIQCVNRLARTLQPCAGCRMPRP
jgi:hypothetical protein